MFSTFCRRNQNVHEQYTNNLCNTKSMPRKKPMERKTITPNNGYDLDIPEVPSDTEATTPGFPNYNSFKAFFDYLYPSCKHLVYQVHKLLLQHLSTRLSVTSQD